VKEEGKTRLTKEMFRRSKTVFFRSFDDPRKAKDYFYTILIPLWRRIVPKERFHFFIITKRVRFFFVLFSFLLKQLQIKVFLLCSKKSDLIRMSEAFQPTFFCVKKKDIMMLYCILL